MTISRTWFGHCARHSVGDRRKRVNGVTDTTRQERHLRAGTFGGEDGQGSRPGDCSQDRQSERRGEDTGAEGQENGTAG